jgi:S-DNA-T family DNA segregation ATPase FtsK/SpoIIIE
MSTEHTEDDRNAQVVPLRPAEPRQPDPGPPKVIEVDVTSHPWTAPPARRPVLPPWLRHADQRHSATKWALTHAGHVAAFHTVRVPLYTVRHAWHSPRGLGRALFHTWSWAFDREGHELRTHAVEVRDAKQYATLARIRKERVRHRLAALAVLAIAFAGVAGLVAAAWAPGRWVLAGFAVLVLGYIGRPAGRPYLQPAVVSAKAERLTGDIIVRALGSLGLAGIDKVLREGREITFVTPVVRDGPGWRVGIDLPYGVTVADVIERRDKLASGLRRPLGCVWPEPDADEHAGRLVLYVCDEPLSKARQPAWPLARAGKADLFRPLPYGTDQRGRGVAITLMFSNLLIGSIPRQGKTVAMRVALLAAALDVLCELRVFELKGTGDLDAVGKVAHAYGSGADDATIEAALASLRQLAEVELIRRAKVIRGLPKDLCPDSKITPQLAAKKSLGLHPILFGLDEAQEAFSHPEYGAAFERYATAVIKRGPALGIMLILATQRPDAKSLPPGITANVGLRFCLRVMDQVANDMVLGTSAYKTGVRATLLTVNDKGCGYLVGAADHAQVTKTYNIDGPAAEKICDRARQARVLAGRLGGYAAGDTEAVAEAASLLADVAACIHPNEADVWSEVLCARLAELRPTLYEALDATSLAEQLGRYGVSTKQIWGRTADGKRANRRGVARADVAAASGQAARSSTAASGTDGDVTSGNTTGGGSSALALAVLPTWPFAHLADSAGAAASGLPWWWPLALLGGLALAAVGYYYACKWWPYGPCVRCLGHPGRIMSPGGKHWRACKRCRGSGRRTRLGARLMHTIDGGDR